VLWAVENVSSRVIVGSTPVSSKSGEKFVNSSQQQAANFWGAETFLRRFANVLTLTVAVMMVVTLGASTALAQAVPVIYGPLSPEQKAPGAATFTLTVYGTGFASDAVVKWNGAALTTTFVTAEKLTASVPAANVATAGTALVTVTNGTGTASNAQYFEIVKNGFTVAYSKIDYATDLTPNDVTTTEFTTSGHLDLAAATGNNTISVLLGNGTGAFPTHVQYAVPGNPYAIIHGDFNGDGNQDLATADQYSSQVSVLLGNGDGTFQGHVEYAGASGGAPVALATADVNGDGKLDLVVVNYKTNNVSVLLGNGDGTFQAHVEYATGNGPMGVAIGDLNGDGKLDLVVANSIDNTVSVLLGNGDGTFQAAVPYATANTPTCVVVGNFTTSDTLDVAIATSGGLASVLLGNGNGTLQNKVNYTIGLGAVAIAAADMNSSGKLSLITANETDNTTSLLVGNGNGTFKSESIFPTNGSPVGLAIGDFNENGKLDIAAVANTGNFASVQLDSLLTLSPTLNSFGTITSGDPSAAKTITLKNNGTTAYTMGTIATIGSYPTDFTIQSASTCPTTTSLAAGASCTFLNVFDPTLSEYANAQVQVTSSNGSMIAYQQTGTGNVPISMNPRTITFSGYQLVGTTSAAKTTTFTNVSGVPVTFTSLVLSGVNQNQFSQTSTCPGLLGNAPGTLAPGASCTSNIYFVPTESGGANVTAIYSGNFTVGRAGSLVSAEATAVSVTPKTLTFPSTVVNISSSPMTVTFQNAGSVALPLTGVWFTGSEPYFSQTNTCNYPNGSVAANSTCTFSVTFSPLTTGTFTATLNIGNSDPTGPQTVKLTGTGTAAPGNAVRLK
jgi:hypothetical protein